MTTVEKRQTLIQPIQEKEIFDALHDIGDTKALGMDGYNAKNFKSYWDTMKQDVISAVCYWFKYNTMSKGFNSTLVLTANLAKVIGSIIGHNQAVFIPGQQIHKHILLAYELIRGYTRKHGTLRCMIQLDLQKAYDMLNWKSLDTILHEMGIPNQFVNWIMNGVTTITYRYNINGEHSKLMKAERGIRQGDPISPFLFVIVMEYMSRLLHQMQLNPNFDHHLKCEKLELTHLTFVDDILLLARGDVGSVTLIHQTLQRRGLPFRYLGVPLTSKKLTVAHYLPLIDKILSRIQHWSARLLSHAGRVQLVKVVGFAIANYWLQCIPIPKAVLKKIHVACRTFIWTSGISTNRKSPISWKNMCKPMVKGGLCNTPFSTQHLY
ncbi:uncharacterized protein LOC131641049 [Vicia villosa]|uniref:uncharacterized protein LOC131641049 n=1 Tax=Vicia villosa TaxID=3911 RepID=UPI00273AF725|nr:uncharacterized protein LOC131641049 [Vicia villosa]